MNVLIAYASRYGTTEKCSRILADKLSDGSNKIEFLNLKKSLKTGLNKYDVVIIDGSFVAFKLNSYTKKFVRIYLNKLIQKKSEFSCAEQTKMAG